MRLNQVTVPSTELERSIKFYEKLGLVLIVKSLPNYARFVALDGGGTFSVHLVGEIEATERAVIYFEVDDIDQKYQELKKEGLVFEHEPVDQVWLWREAKLLDPDGNPIILYFAGENRLNPPWRIN